MAVDGFFNAARRPFLWGTYFPPYAKWGSVGFIDLLNSIAKAWESDRENILSSSRSITEELASADSMQAAQVF